MKYGSCDMYFKLNLVYRQAISSGPLELALPVPCLVHLSSNLRPEDEDEGIVVRAAFRKRC